MNKRFKEMRKQLGLSQEELGKRIGIGKSAVSKIENGENAPSEQTLLSICREFRVNYFWLTEGKGDMFAGTPQTAVDELAEDYDLDDDDKKILERYLELDAEKRKILKEFLKSIFI